MYTVWDHLQGWRGGNYELPHQRLEKSTRFIKTQNGICSNNNLQTQVRRSCLKSGGKHLGTGIKPPHGNLLFKFREAGNPRQKSISRHAPMSQLQCPLTKVPNIPVHKLFHIHKLYMKYHKCLTAQTEIMSLSHHLAIVVQCTS